MKDLHHMYVHTNLWDNTNWLETTKLYFTTNHIGLQIFLSTGQIKAHPSYPELNLHFYVLYSWYMWKLHTEGTDRAEEPTMTLVINLETATLLAGLVTKHWATWNSHFTDWTILHQGDSMQFNWDVIQNCEIIDWRKSTNWFIKTLRSTPDDERNYYKEDGSVIFNFRLQGWPSEAVAALFKDTEDKVLYITEEDLEAIKQHKSKTA